MKTKTPNSKLQTPNFRRVPKVWNLGFGHWKLNRGVTLIELLLYMGLLAIFLLVLTDIFVAITSVRTETETISAVEQDGRFILSRLAYDISRADDINVPLQLGQTRSNLRMTIGGITYEYSESGGNMQLSNDLSTSSLNSSQTTIYNPTFQRIGNTGGKDTIKITFTATSVTQQVGTGTQTKTFTTTVGRR